MVRPDLRIVAGTQEGAERRAPRSVAIGFGALILAVAGLATLLGADSARVELEPREIASEAVRTALDQGSDSPEVRASMVGLRSNLGRRPLDNETRVAYASLVLGLSRTMDELRVAAFHARLAARLAPVTVPVIRGAALALVRTGDADEAVVLIHDMFGYDPGAAARLLIRCEPLLYKSQVEGAIAETPRAWAAWARQIRLEGRTSEAEDWFDRGHDRWPDDLPLLTQATRRAVRDRDWQKLETLLPPERELPEEPEAASLFVHRARLELQRGRPEAATADVERALRLGGGRQSVLIQAGDVYSTMGSDEEARRLWNRALYRLPADATAGRRTVLRRLARLEERVGRSGLALHHWRSILETDPEDGEARGRVAALTGSVP